MSEKPKIKNFWGAVGDIAKVVGSTILIQTLKNLFKAKRPNKG